MDPREEKLADILTSHSLTIKKGDFIGLRYGIEAKDLALACYKKILEKGAIPITHISLPEFEHAFFSLASQDQLTTIPPMTKLEAQTISGVLAIGTEQNVFNLSKIDQKKMRARKEVMSEIQDILIDKDNWVYFEYPTPALAQSAGMPSEEFKDLIFKASLRDWDAEKLKQEKIKAILDNGINVRIKGENTDLSFSIENRQAVMCYGKRNMPDGEVFIAPVETTTNGYVNFSFPAFYNGREIEGVFLQFKDGEVIKATAKKNEDFLKEMISIDKGAKRLGEFGIATNTQLTQPLKQVLFDEKIGGTIHLALGRAYKKGNGKNESKLHWDIVKDLRSQGEVWIDDFCLLKDGVLNI